jgi:hypothetical protein
MSTGLAPVTAFAAAPRPPGFPAHSSVGAGRPGSCAGGRTVGPDRDQLRPRRAGGTSGSSYLLRPDPRAAPRPTEDCRPGRRPPPPDRPGFLRAHASYQAHNNVGTHQRGRTPRKHVMERSRSVIRQHAQTPHHHHGPLETRRRSAEQTVMAWVRRTAPPGRPRSVDVHACDYAGGFRVISAPPSPAKPGVRLHLVPPRARFGGQVRRCEHYGDVASPGFDQRSRYEVTGVERRRSASRRALRAETTFPLRSKSPAAFSLSTAASAGAPASSRTSAKSSRP